MNLRDLKSTVKEGLQNLVPQKDQSIAAYEKLEPSDFVHLMEKFGAEPVLKYIRDMEARRPNVRPPRP